MKKIVFLIAVFITSACSLNARTIISTTSVSPLTIDKSINTYFDALALQAGTINNIVTPNVEGCTEHSATSSVSYRITSAKTIAAGAEPTISK